MGLNVPLAFYEMKGDNVFSSNQTSMPFHYNMNVRPKVRCKPLCVNTFPMFLRFFVTCPFVIPLFDVFAKCL